MDEKKGFIFLRSYHLAIKELTDEQRLAVYDAICQYALDGVVPEMSGVVKSIFILIRPTIDASQQKWESKIEAGRKGGKASTKQKESKDEANDKQKESKDEAKGKLDKDKEKEKDKEKDKEKEYIPPIPPKGDGVSTTSLQEKRFSEFWKVYPKKRAKDAAWKAWKKIAPDTELFTEIVGSVQAHIASTDWRKDNGQYIPNPATYLNQGRWKDELNPTTEAYYRPPGFDPNDPFADW